ncbi:hypothetical protein RESH_02757 [Rhodopirellula europaea SH398]|uniref:Uncharacterized protein n=1 Tax=Rhodopirellula europaea SH398 TaxID=1263868 RepID=M5S546_9BACT|nr:hypothetical protein RESH_02757 [Rhodopirellula europaea SH398]
MIEQFPQGGRRMVDQEPSARFPKRTPQQKLMSKTLENQPVGRKPSST